MVLANNDVTLWITMYMDSISTRKLVFAVVALSLYPLIRQLID